MMLRFSKAIVLGSFYVTLLFSTLETQQLSAYVSIPRSSADTTTRMNTGGDPANRPGLLDVQRSPEYLDDWWGRNDYYYSTHGIQETHSIINPEFDTEYPYPNAYNPPTGSNEYYNSGRQYRPGYPRW